MILNNLRIYFILIFTNNLWFITSNWLNFWLKYMSLKEVGIIDAIAFLAGILLEFPSGLISDKLGRKQALLIAQSLQLLGSLIITLASNLWEIGAGFILFQVGVAFYSGTIEAFGYEASARKSENYTKTLIKSGSLTNFSYLGSLVIGGYLYSLNQNLPNMLFTLNFLIGLIAVFMIKNSSLIEEEKTNLPFKLKISVLDIFLFIILMSLAFSFDYGFLKLIILEKFSTLETNYWYIFLATLISLVVSSLWLPRLKNYRNTLLIALVLIILAFLIGIWSLIPLFLVLSFLAIFIYQLSLKYINEKVGDNHRAGVISLFNLCYKLPYVLIALVLGYNLA
jgi:MFS family permease